MSENFEKHFLHFLNTGYVTKKVNFTIILYEYFTPRWPIEVPLKLKIYVDGWITIASKTFLSLIWLWIGSLLERVNRVWCLHNKLKPEHMWHAKDEHHAAWSPFTSRRACGHRCALTGSPYPRAHLWFTGGTHWPISLILIKKYCLTSVAD